MSKYQYFNARTTRRSSSSDIERASDVLEKEKRPNSYVARWKISNREWSERSARSACFKDQRVFIIRLTLLLGCRFYLVVAIGLATVILPHRAHLKFYDLYAPAIAVALPKSGIRSNNRMFKCFIRVVCSWQARM